MLGAGGGYAHDDAFADRCEKLPLCGRRLRENEKVP